MGENVLNNLNLLLEKFFGTIETEVFALLDRLYKITPDILKEEPLNKFQTKDVDSNILLILISISILFIVFYLITYMISVYSGNKQENLFKFVFKLSVFLILSSSSMYIVETILDINNIFTDIVLSVGNDVAKTDISFVNLKECIIDAEKHMSTDAVSIDGIIKGVVSIGASSMLINFAIRYVTIVILILLAPVAIMFAASNNTCSLFFAWLKTFLLNLLMQNIVVVVLIIPLSFKNTDEIMYKIVLVGSIYLLYKINTFARELINISGGVNGGKR